MNSQTEQQAPSYPWYDDCVEDLRQNLHDLEEDYCLHGIKSSGIFVGPTGSGKSYLWRYLQKIYPNRIEIVDGSGISKEGWAGSQKWKDLLRSPHLPLRESQHSCL